MDLGIKGKVAMVAAGSKGIGFAAAKALIAEGCTVSICSRAKESVDAAVAQLGANCKGFVCDVSNSQALEKWFQDSLTQMGKAEILVTNTGGPPAGNVLAMTDEQWNDGVQSTLMNIIRMVRLAVPAMKEKGWGRIIHVSSLVAKEPSKFLPISSTLRTGIMSLTKLQAWELAMDCITVNGVLPGHTKTDRQIHLAEVRAESEKISLDEAIIKQSASTAMRRFASPDEIAAAIAFFASVPASYVSGTSLLVDGATTCAFG
jgi:3-oxoacyl-[acyl-carrier protein] reductase